MAHFAKLDENNIVTQVIVVANRDTADASGVEKEHIGAAWCEKLLGGTWKQTSYNGNFRRRFAGIGMRYDADLDIFIAEKPYDSWTLDENGNWQAPVAMPEDAGTGDPPKNYVWDEENQRWVAPTSPEAELP